MRTLTEQESQRFTRTDDDWWLDTTTGLEWSPTTPQLLTWLQAIQWCREQGGRLPTIYELTSLIDYNLVKLATQLPDTVSDVYWSSTTYQNLPTFAWGVYFHDGTVDYFTKSRTLRVRAVRDGVAKGVKI